MKIYLLVLLVGLISVMASMADWPRLKAAAPGRH